MNHFKQRELEYELRHEDEYNRRQKSLPKLIGMWFFNVPKSEERVAQDVGLEKTKSGKWALKHYNTSGATYQMKLRAATDKFGQGKYWSPKNESFKENI